MKKTLISLLLCLTLSDASSANNLLERLTAGVTRSSIQAPANQLVEVGFSPDGGAQELVLKVIRASRHSLRLAAYSFTSPDVVQALMEAKRRGVDVRVLIDEKGNKSRSSIAAMNLVVNAGIPLRTISAYAIHHDKYLVADERHVQNGSFNYTKAAAKSNSENVLVIWNNPELAAAFSSHWLARWNQGKEVLSAY